MKDVASCKINGVLLVLQSRISHRDRPSKKNCLQHIPFSRVLGKYYSRIANKFDLIYIQTEIYILFSCLLVIMMYFGHHPRTIIFYGR